MRTGSVETEPVHFEAIADELWEVRFVGKTMKGTDSLNLILLFILCMLLLVAGLNIQPPYSYACLTLGGAILVAAMLGSANGFTVHVTQAKEL